MTRPTGDDSGALARAVIDCLREPGLLLDSRLRVVAANRAYCLAFKAERKDLQGRPVRAVNDGRWDTPEVLAMLGRVRQRSFSAESHEMEQDVPGVGRRTLVLRVSGGLEEAGACRLMLMSIEDVSARRVSERDSARLVQQMETLLLANQHQTANSLQIVASILLEKTRSVQSQEVRNHLENVHSRIMSVASVQHQLVGTKGAGRIALAPYLGQLCETLDASMISQNRSVSIACRVDDRRVCATEAISLGLIVTELVMNALKHAFTEHPAAGRIAVTYDLSDDAWCLAVSDNGIGFQAETTGLGTSIISALVSQIGGCVEVATGSSGTTVSISHRRD